MTSPEQMLLRRLRALPDAADHDRLILELEDMDARMRALRNTFWALPISERQEVTQARTRLTVRARDILRPGFTPADAAAERAAYTSAFGPHEKYTVELHGTAWDMAVSGALLAAWQVARELGTGLTPEQADRIAFAAMWKLRDMVERRALDQKRDRSE